jgi:type II secretory pathway pseudopilin PulG
MRIINRRSFTLLEILIAATIFVIVIGMVYTIFSGTLSYWKRGYSLNSRQQAARLVFSRMTDNISSLFLSIPRNIYCFGLNNKFYFVSSSVKGGEGDLAEMGYELVQLENRLVFSYQEKADFDFDTYDYKNTIAVDVMGLNFSYLDKDGSWRSDWDSRLGGQQEKSPPQAIKISLEIKNTDSTDGKEVFETIVELPIRTKYM